MKSLDAYWAEHAAQLADAPVDPATLRALRAMFHAGAWAAVLEVSEAGAPQPALERLVQLLAELKAETERMQRVRDRLAVTDGEGEDTDG